MNLLGDEMVLRANLDIKKIPPKTINDVNGAEILVEGEKFYCSSNDRYILEISIKSTSSKKNTLTVIMFNPSESGIGNKGLFVDQTITNIIKIANDTGYNFIKVLNLITTINSNEKEISKDTFIDIDFLISEIDDTDLLLAWGTEGQKRINRNKKLIDKLRSKKNVFTFCPSKKKYPKHPARLDLNCCRNCYGRSGSFTLEEFTF